LPQPQARRRSLRIVVTYQEVEEVRVTIPKLSRAAACCAVLSGLLYIAIQFIHPEETLEAVSTDSWVVVALLTVAMAVLGLVGVAGIYLRQTEETGMLGLLGALFLGLFFLLPITFSFAEALILPLIVSDAPGFVENFNGLFNGEGTDGTLGALESISLVAGVLYLAGGVLFGLAVFRARILWAWPALLLTAGAAITPFTALVPHEVGRFAAVPVGVALVGLGLSLWSETKGAPSRESLGMATPRTTQPAL
jgi:hypothetical protein